MSFRGATLAFVALLALAIGAGPGRHPGSPAREPGSRVSHRAACARIHSELGGSLAIHLGGDGLPQSLTPRSSGRLRFRSSRAERHQPRPGHRRRMREAVPVEGARAGDLRGRHPTAGRRHCSKRPRNYNCGSIRSRRGASAASSSVIARRSACTADSACIGCRSTMRPACGSSPWQCAWPGPRARA
jgi:hypothetical protein